MNKIGYVTNVGSLYFMFHIKDIISGKYEVSGIENVSIICYNMVSSNEVQELIDFKSFSDEYNSFENYHVSDLARNIWNGLDGLKLALGSIMSKSVEREGLSFNPNKSKIFPLSLESWSYIKYRLLSNDSKFLIYKYNTKSRIRRMRHGLKYVSIPIERKWEYARFETQSQLTLLHSLLGPHCTKGVTKEKPSRRNNFTVTLNLNDTINIVQPLEVSTKFSRRNLKEFGVNLMHCNGIGGKVWVRFKTVIANNVPEIKEIIEAMTVTENLFDNEDEVESVVDAFIEPGKSIFYFENCALRVESVLSESVYCKVMQSSNRNYPIGSTVTFDNEEQVKALIILTLNT